ncbi:hypothetical protein IK146_01205 [Candidatus Saccharibacteria bacterium]|nr:hypothetical protein [Candidatus Saccharibacteria bacterium]
MEEDVEKGRPIALIASSIAAVLVIGLLLLYKPQKTEKTPDLDAIETHVETSYDTQEIASEPTVELNIEIVEAERRDNQFYVQVQTNDAFDGDCKFTLMPANEDGSLEHDTKLEPADRVSVCESDFPLRALDGGNYELIVLVTAKDGSKKSISKTVTIE